MEWMINTFRQNNRKWSSIRIVMANKDIGEKDVIKSCLPNASVLICLFHALMTFRWEVTCEKLGISAGEKIMALENFHKMAYAASQEQYEALNNELKNSVPKQIFEYFEKNWNMIKSEWVLHYKAQWGSFLNSTNNRLEYLNANNTSN